MRIPLVIAFSLAMTACAGSSPRIAQSQLSELEKGRTTITEVVRKFGRPSIVSKNPDGTQTAIYIHGEGASVATTMVPLISTAPADSETFYFDTSGVLTDYKVTLVNAGKPAAAGSAVNTQAGDDKSAPAGSDRSATAGAGKTAKSDDKPRQGESGGWTFLIPSATKQNR